MMIPHCTGFVWQSFGSRGDYRDGFCEKLPEASLCLMEPMQAGSKTELPPAKAETTSDVGSTSVIMYLRRWGKKKLQKERRVRICDRNNSADIKVSEEGGGGGAPGTRAEVPLQPVKTVVRQAVPLQSMEDLMPK